MESKRSRGSTLHNTVPLASGLRPSPNRFAVRGHFSDERAYALIKRNERIPVSSNEEVIRQRYAEAVREDGRSTSSRANSLEFHYTAKLIRQYIDQGISVLEIGCGTGYYGVHFADKCKEYVGIDLSPECIDMLNSKIDSRQLKNVRAMVGNATSLDGIENSCFDVVMVLGPMYHLPPDERDLVFSECKRVCRMGGIIILAYVSKVGVYVNAFLAVV